MRGDGKIDDLDFRGSPLAIKVVPGDCDGESFARIRNQMNIVEGPLQDFCKKLYPEVRGILEEHKFEIRL